MKNVATPPGVRFATRSATWMGGNGNLDQSDATTPVAATPTARPHREAALAATRRSTSTRPRYGGLRERFASGGPV